ncbi:MAG: U32 family peptidase, partial [Clostridiales bacterium]|nr:U32 family peptidase [Clostridiales bacterium]
DHSVCHTARKNYLNGEYQRVPVRFAAELKLGRGARIVAADDRRNTATAIGGKPEPAFHRATDAAALRTAFHRTEGTPFYCAGVKSVVEPDIVLQSGELAKMCRSVLAQLLEKRKALPEPKKIAEYKPALIDVERQEPPVFTVSVTRANQLSKELLDLAPAVLYVPVGEFRHTALLRPYIENPDITVAASLPNVILPSEQKRIFDILGAAKLAGVSDALVSNVGHILPARELGFNVRGDYGLNIFSSYSLAAARDLGLRSAMLSFEMSLDQIRAAAKSVDTEIFAYGRLPLMYTENCVIKLALGVCACESSIAISDVSGAKYPVMRASADSCRNFVFSPRKIFLAGRTGDFKGAWGMRLAFSTENAQECAAVMRRYIGEGQYEPGGITRGLYYKGVQ